MNNTQSHPLEKFCYCPRCGSSRFVVNNASSKRCEDCGFVYYFNPRAAVVAVICDEKGRLLVAKRAKEPAKDTLDLPGGFTECYETAEESLAREVMEETSIVVDNAHYLFSEHNIYPYSGIDIHTMDLFYWVRVDSRVSIESRDDVASLHWVSWHELKPEDFGLLSIRRGVERLLKCNLHCDIEALTRKP